MSERLEYWSGNQAAGEALTAGHIVAMSSGTIIHADTPTTLPLGVVLHDCDSGSIPVVVTGGVVNVVIETSNTPSAGELIRIADAPTAAGKGAEATATATVLAAENTQYEWIIGTAVQDTADEGASGDNMCRVRVCQPFLNIYGVTP